MMSMNGTLYNRNGGTETVLSHLRIEHTDIHSYLMQGQTKQIECEQVKPIGFEAPRGGAYNNQKHLKLERPCS